MKLIPSSLQVLVQELSKLPGVGERTALRYSVALLKAGPKRSDALMRALQSTTEQITHCETCFFWKQENSCPICEDLTRNNKKLCVVRDAPDVLAFEKYKSHSWKYHILQGLLSPLVGVGPSQLRISAMFERLESDEFDEVILAVDPTVEGDATSLFIRDHLKNKFPTLKVTRTALGLPAGSSVEYLDPSTLENALLHRTTLE